MKAHILALSCKTPKFCLYQKNIANTFNKSLNLSESKSKKLSLIFENSKIEKRYSIVSDYQKEKLGGSLFGDDFPHQVPDTLTRNQLYQKEAPKLAASVAKEALLKWGKDKNAITHVISVSCTGMYAPGIEFFLIEELGLKEDVQRLGLNFMGCFGAFKGIAIGKALANENPEFRILVVCTELCSLHFQKEATIENFVANALFADGAGAVIIGCCPEKEETSLFEIEKNTSYALKDSQDLMSWEIGNSGMLMRLSSEVPKMIAAHITPFVKNLVGINESITNSLFAIHPGGKAIVEAIEKAFALNEEQTRESWETLKEFGNMSSATFLFILEKVLKNNSPLKRIVGLGFGPGLSIEGLLLKQ